MIVSENFKPLKNKINLDNRVIKLEDEFLIVIKDKAITSLIFSNEIFTSSDILSLLLHEDFIKYLETQKKPEKFNIEEFIKGVKKAIQYPVTCLDFCSNVEELKDIMFDDDIKYFEKSFRTGELIKDELEQYKAKRGSLK